MSDHNSLELVPVRQAILVRHQGKPNLALAKVRGKYWFEGEKNLRLRGNKVRWVQRVDGVLYRRSTDYGPEPEYEAAIRAKIHQFYLEAKGAADGVEKRATIPTVGEWYQTYTDTITPSKEFPRGDKKMLPFVDAHRNKRLTEIDRLICRAWISKRKHTHSNRGRNYAANSIRTERSLLKALFEAAIEDLKLSMRNPWDEPRRGGRGKKVKILPAPTFCTRVLTHKEQERLMPELCRVRLPGGKKGVPRFKIDHEDARWVTVILGGGLRHREFLDLRPCDLQDNVLNVIGKNDKERNPPIGEEVYAALEEQRAARGLARNSEALYFAFGYTRANARLGMACKRAGIPHVTVHDLRRTYGWRCGHEFKLDVGYVAELLGHADIKVTNDHYMPKVKAHLKQMVLERIRVTVPQTPDTKEITPPVKRMKTGAKG